MCENMSPRCRCSWTCRLIVSERSPMPTEGRRLFFLATILAIFVGLCCISDAGDVVNVRKGIGSQVLLNVRDGQIRDGIGSRVLYNVRDGQVREGIGSKVVLNIRSGDIREGIGSRVLYNLRRRMHAPLV